MVKQIIIVRKDLHMSYGKFGAQILHAGQSFFTDSEDFDNDDEWYDEWLNDGQPVIICSARNKTNLMKAKTIAESLDLREGKDFWIIDDACLTELKPEDWDEDGNGYTTTCIGFRPLKEEIANKISKKFQLY